MAVARAGKTLLVETSEERANRFADRVLNLGEIDVSNAFPLPDEWLVSSGFHPWQAWETASPEAGKHILRRMEQAFMQMNPRIARIETVRRRMPRSVDRAADSDAR